MSAVPPKAAILRGNSKRPFRANNGRFSLRNPNGNNVDEADKQPSNVYTDYVDPDMETELTFEPVHLFHRKACFYL